MFRAPSVSTFAYEHRQFRWRGAVSGLILAPATVVTALSTPLVPANSVWQLPIRAAAWTCFVAGTALRFWATLYIGGRKDTELVTTGPYSVCRNPLYIGSFLLGIAAGLFLESVAFSTAVVAAFVVYQRTTVRVEEEVLRARHGRAFDDYARRVSRFFPRRWRLQTPDHLNVHVRSLWTECARASRWIWLPALGEILTRLRTHVWWPTYFRGL
jgi:protein-S-isoprenylcysteine O-methyltransferase Ste14